MSDALFERHEIFVATAAVGAHANSYATGFRQRDVRFLIELFSNWVECALRHHVLPIQNTQVLRYLETLVTEGFARKISKKTAYPHYRLTRTGLIELLTRLVDRDGEVHREEFFFLFYFLKNYRPRLESLVKAEGKQFPYSLRLELEALLDVRALIVREMENTKREIKKLEQRISDAESTTAHVTRGLLEGEPLPKLVREVQRLFPYELNSQKQLSELIEGIPPEVREWELREGNVFRVDEIWNPCLTLLRAYLGELVRLEEKMRTSE